MTQRSQPVRVPTGLPFGERQALEDQQRAAPLPNSEGGPPQPAGPPTPQSLRPDIYGPTTRPDEPLTAGAPAGPGPDNLGMLPPDEVGFLRALYLKYPSPGLARMLEFAIKRSRQ